MKNITLDCRGHSISSVENTKKALSNEINIWIKLLVDKPESLEKIFDDFSCMSSPKCFVCGEYLEFKTIDKGKNFVTKTECLYKNGFPPIEVNLEVPSGEILLFNDFRDSYSIENRWSIDLNSTAGIKKYTEHYAKQGLIIHYIGNSSPRVIQRSDERLEIGNFWCKKEDGCVLSECPMPSCNRPKEIGSICTNLWWYCAVDKDEFEKRIGKTTEQYQEEYHATGAWPDIVRAKIVPGTYRTVGQYHIDSNDLYSYIEKIS